jgi:hypothetical protein
VPASAALGRIVGELRVNGFPQRLIQLPYRNPVLTAKMTAWLDATAVPASLRMLLPMKQIFGKSVAAEEPMVCMTHRWRGMDSNFQFRAR